jgi:hypothetical protein
MFMGEKTAKEWIMATKKQMRKAAADKAAGKPPRIKAVPLPRGPKIPGTPGPATKYCPELLQAGEDYLENWKELGDAIPQLASLSLYVGASVESMNNWRKHPDKAEFNDLCHRILMAQQQELINRGLTKDHDASLTKLLLRKHGFTDGKEIDVKSSDGSMSPNEDAKKLARGIIEDEFGE